MISVKQMISSIIFLFLNYVVSYIPIWHIRKIFYMLFGMKIGKGSRIYMKCTVVDPWQIVIGENTVINEKCYLDGRGGLVIGSNTSISMQSIILTASHDRKSAGFNYYEGKVIIKDNVWLGARAIVLDNSIIENGCIIAAGSSFKGFTEAGYIYAGIPAKKTKERKLESLYELSYRDFFR